MPVASCPRCCSACKPSAVSAAASGWPYTPKTPHSSWKGSASKGSVVAILDPRFGIGEMVTPRFECEWQGMRATLSRVFDQPVQIAPFAGLVVRTLILARLRRRRRHRTGESAHRLLSFLSSLERPLRVIDDGCTFDLKRLRQQAAQHVRTLSKKGFALCLSDPARPIVRRQADIEHEIGERDKGRTAHQAEDQSQGPIDWRERGRVDKARQVSGNDRQQDQSDHEQSDTGDEVGEQRRRDEPSDQPIDIVEPIERDQRRPDPGYDRQGFAHEAAGKGKDRRECDHPEDAEIDSVHDAATIRRWPSDWPRSACLGANRSTSSLRCPIAAISNPAAAAVPRRFPRPLGIQASAKPSLAGSFSRASVGPAGRTLLERAISPNTTASGTGVSVSAETSAAATARSAAGSTMRNPPATLR